MADNSILATKFYLTSRAGEQLPQKEYEPSVQNSSNPFAIGDYVSTVEQDSSDDKNLSAAVKNNAFAGFSLNKNSSVANFNSYMKKVQLNEFLNKKSS